MRHHQFSQDWNEILLAFTSRFDLNIPYSKNEFLMLEMKILDPKILIEDPEHIFFVPSSILYLFTWKSEIYISDSQSSS